jgi:peptide/nickel transport system permease protein
MEVTPATVATTPVAEAAASGVKVEVAKTRKLGVIGWAAVGWLVAIVGGAILAPILPIADPDERFRGLARQPPFTDGHLLGGDRLGHDMLAQVVYAARISLVVATGAVLLGLLVGGLLGLLAGYLRGRTDTVLTTGFNVLLSIPALVLALSLVAVLASSDSASGAPGASTGRKMVVLILALGIVTVPILGRITRASALSWSERDFVKAAQVAGAKPARIMFREVLPNVLPAMMSITLLGIAVAIVAEGSLALLGVGITEEPTWGNMVDASRKELSQNGQVHMVVIPSLAIFFTVFALNYLGDVVRARFDVREGVL